MRKRKGEEGSEWKVNKKGTRDKKSKKKHIFLKKQTKCNSPEHSLTFNCRNCIS